MNYHVSIIIEQEENWYVALCPELDITSQGKSIEEARDNLKEALELYLKYADPQEITAPIQPLYVSTLDIAV